MPQVVVEKNYGEAKRAVIKGLVAFNRAAVGNRPWKQIAVTVRDEGRIVGGALGALWLEWLFIELLWLGEAFRRRDLGTELMGKLEDDLRHRSPRQLIATLTALSGSSLPKQRW